MDYENTSGYRIKMIRQQNNMSQKEFAKILNITYFWLSKIERNKTDISTFVIRQLKEHFNCSADYILFGIGDQ